MSGGCGHLPLSHAQRLHMRGVSMCHTGGPRQPLCHNHSVDSLSFETFQNFPHSVATVILRLNLETSPRSQWDTYRPGPVELGLKLWLYPPSPELIPTSLPGSTENAWPLPCGLLGDERACLWGGQGLAPPDTQEGRDIKNMFPNKWEEHAGSKERAGIQNRPAPE